MRQRYKINQFGGCSVVFNSLRPHGLQPARLLCPWDFPGKNTGVGCHSFLQDNLVYHLQKDWESIFLRPYFIPVKEELLNSLPSVQFSSIAQLCPTLCDPMNCSTPGLPVHQQLPEFTQTHVQRVGEAIQPSHPLSSPSPPAPNPSQHQSLFQWVNSLHEVAKVLGFQL